MSIDEIAALPVADIAADNAHIYLWITNRSLPKGFALLERWSVEPCASSPAGKIGWTLDPAKITDLVLFTFDPTDTTVVYLLPFQHLRKAFIDFGKSWLDEYGPMAFQSTNGRWRSACLFVPAGEVLDAVRAVCIGTIARDELRATA